MNEVVFVTSNQGKFQSLLERFPSDKYKLVQENISLPELQGNTSIDVSVEKAKEAFKIINKPLIIQDSAFHIKALNGFPGPYIKYVQETLGLEGILKVLDGVEDRSCYFEQAVTYIDTATIKTFVGDRYVGTVANEISTITSTKAWGLIWKIFIPEGYTKPISELTEPEIRAFDKDRKSEFSKFIDWLITK